MTFWDNNYIWFETRGIYGYCLGMCCIKLKVIITKLKLVGDDQTNIKLYMTFLVKK